MDAVGACTAPNHRLRSGGVPTLGDFAVARNPGIDSGVFDAHYTQRVAKELYYYPVQAMWDV